jgi:hypothetical protein
MVRLSSMGRPSRGALLILATVVAGGAVSVFVHHKFFGEPEVYSLCPADRSSTAVVHPSQILDGSRPYSGPGPHRIVVIGPSDTTGALPADWHTSRIPNGWGYQVDELELAACEYVYAIGDEGDLGTCRWKEIGGDAVEAVTTKSAKYDYHLFEAATGRLLTTFTVKGVHEGCADTKVIHGSGHGTMAAQPDREELKRLLEPLVTGQVR